MDKAKHNSIAINQSLLLTEDLIISHRRYAAP